jgi:penicillin-binding protein 1C
MVLGLEPFVDKLRALGFSGLREDPGYYGFSLALGTVDVSLFDLVQAYAALANSGAFRPLTLKKGESGPARQALSPQAAFIVSDILSDRESRSATFGLENHLSTRYWTAVKTGTSKDMRDNWCVGYSRKYTVGVWVGNFSGDPMWNVTGVTGAAPVWMDMMDLLHRTTASTPPAPPQGLVRNEARFLIREPPRMEWYLAGTEPHAPVTPALAHARRTIAYPPDGASIALDPDIPRANQAVRFRAEPQSGAYRWILNGSRVGTGPHLLWKPVAGLHTLAVSGPDSTILDSVRFSVK